MSELSNQLVDWLTSTEDICVAFERQVQDLAKIYTPMELTTAFCYALHHIQHGCDASTEDMVANVTLVLQALALICTMSANDNGE